MYLSYTGSSCLFSDSDVIYRSIKATKKDRRVKKNEVHQNSKKNAIDENISQYSTADESDEIKSFRHGKK